MFLSEIASDALKGRVFEVSLADLQNDEVAFRKFRLMVEEVQGKSCLTNFHGMNLTRDKYCSMVKKWQVRHFKSRVEHTFLDQARQLTRFLMIFENWGILDQHF